MPWGARREVDGETTRLELPAQSYPDPVEHVVATADEYRLSATLIVPGGTSTAVLTHDGRSVVFHGFPPDPFGREIRVSESSVVLKANGQSTELAFPTEG